jgi:hypothetical protein
MTRVVSDLKDSMLRRVLLIGGLIPAILIIIWGELSEFNVNLWILPTINVPSNYLVLEQFLIGTYYLLSPVLILAFLRKFVFPNHNLRFLVLILVTVFSYGLLRYSEYVYDTRGLPSFDIFGNFFPLVFWSLPLISTGAASLILSAKS